MEFIKILIIHLLLSVTKNTIFNLNFHVVDGQIDYYTDKWKIPQSVYVAIETHEILCRNPIVEYYNDTIEKLIVSMFIGRFKFGGGDFHTSDFQVKSNNYQGGFPQVLFNKLDAFTVNMCQVDSQDCVHFIFKQLTTVSLEKINYLYGPNTYPGKEHRVVTVKHKNEYISPKKLYSFQTTSMIYLCYWAILVDDPINLMNWSCRMPGKAFKQTIRSRCMLNAACPNPCCGDQIRVNDTNKDCPGAELCTALTKFPGSLCRRLEGHDFYRGISPDEFSISGLSFECECPQNEEWHSDYLACLDKDECLIGSHKCDRNTQYCVNRPKGYFCACRWGHRAVGRYLCELKPLGSLNTT